MNYFSKMAKCQERYTEKSSAYSNRYGCWIAEKEEKRKSGTQFMSGPLVTIVPFFTYKEWVQDGVKTDYRDRVGKLFEHIETQGDYFLFVNGCGELEPDALYCMLEAAVLQNADVVYCDEDVMQDEIRMTPYMKPDWSPHTLDSFCYIGNCFLIRKSIVSDTVVNRTFSSDPSGIYEFLRQVCAKSDIVTHVSEILFHAKPDGRSMLSVNGKVPEYLKMKQQPLVSVIIPSKDHVNLLMQCIRSIVTYSSYQNYEIIVIDNGSTQENQTSIMQYMEDYPFSYYYGQMEFNFSAMCNQGASFSKGDYLLFLNDDVEVNDPDFLYKMLYYAQQEQVGAVGAKLLYPNTDLIQHVGIANQPCGPTHKLSMCSDSISHYFEYNKKNRDVLAVTGACLIVSREKYFQVDGFSDKMKVSYNDVDLCLKLFEKGYYNVICNEAVLYHHESVSRGHDDQNEEAYRRLQAERKLLYQTHSWLKKDDPFLNCHMAKNTIALLPDYLYEYEDDAFRNEYEVLQKDQIKGRSNKRLQFTIERSVYKRAPEWVKHAEDYYEFEGWSMINERNNACYERYFLLIPEQGEVIRIKLSDKRREDVVSVFPKAKNAELSGFVLRINQSLLKGDMLYQMGIQYISQITPAKYLSLGETYEPRGLL